MKKFYCLILLCGILVTGCQKDQNVDAPVPTPAEYTVMIYGCGGGNLDPYLQENLQQASVYGSTDRVKITAQIKFSKPYQSDEEMKGTRRFVIVKDDVSDLSVEDVSLPLNDPRNIADYINWCKKVAPAKNYILVLWNHGGGWMPDTDPKSRAVIFDDNLDDIGVSLNELIAGVKLSQTRMKMIYYDACLMMMLENLCDLSSVADYAMGAAHSIPSEGGEYDELLKELNSNASFTEAMTRYTKTVMQTWEPTGYNVDISVTNLQKLAPVTTIIDQVAQELVTTYAQHKSAYDQAAKECYYVDDESPFCDIVDYVDNLASASHNAPLINYAASLREAAKQATVCSQRSASLGTQEIYWSTTLVNKTIWTAESYNDGSYQSTAFDVLTGWSRWLAVNELEMRPSYDPDADHDHE